MVARAADLLIRVGVDSRDISRGFRKADQALGNFQRRSERSLRRFDVSLKGAIGSVSRFIGPTALGSLVAGGFIGGIKETISNLAGIADAANRVGVSAEFLQQFRFAAEQVGLGTRQADIGLQRFVRRIGEAANGSGELKDTLDRLGVSVRDDVTGAVRSAEDVLLDFADAIAESDSSAEQLAATFKGFDSEFAGFVNALKLGREGLKELFDDAAVISNEMVERAKDIDDRWTELSNTIGVELVNALNAVLTPFDNAFGLSVQGKIAKTQAELDGINERLENMRSGSLFPLFGDTLTEAQLVAEKERLEGEIRAFELIRAQREASRTNQPPPPGSGGGSEEEKEKTNQLLEQIAALERQAEIVNFTNLQREQEAALFEARKNAQEDYENGLRASADLTTEELRIVLELVNARVSAENAIEAQAEAEKEATEAARERLKLEEERAREAEKAAEDFLREQEKMQAEAERLGENLASAVVDPLIQGIRAGEDFNSILLSISQTAANLFLQLGQNALTSALGGFGSGIFGGGGGNLSQIAAADIAANPNIFHGGGVVGHGGPRRTVSASAFRNAPRLHNGLAADEFPAILQRGERVIPNSRFADENVLPGMTFIFNGVSDFDSFKRSKLQFNAQMARALQQAKATL